MVSGSCDGFQMPLRKTSRRDAGSQGVGALDWIGRGGNDIIVG
jgi:hypothetical protein